MPAVIPQEAGFGSALLVIDADIDDYPPTINSAAILDAQGYDVTVASSRQGALRHPFAPGVKVHSVEPVGSGLPRLARLAWKVARHVRLIRPSVIVGYDITGVLVARAAQLWLRVTTGRRAVLVYHNHDPVAWERKPGLRRFGRPLESWLARNADIVIVPDTHRARWFAGVHSLDTAPVIVRNCPRLLLQRSPAIMRRKLAELGYQFQYIVLRQQSRFGLGHGLEAVISSMPHWPRDTGLVLIGGEGTQGYLDSLRRIADNVGVLDRLAVLPRVPYHELSAYTMDADIGLAVYEDTSFNHLYSAGASNKLYEYTAAGVPVLANANLPGYAEVVEQTGIGRCISLDSPREIADAVHELRRGSARDVCATAGRHMFMQHWNYEAQFAPVIHQLDSLARTGKC